MFAENVGLPLPGELLVVAAAYLAPDVGLSRWKILLAAALGAFLGDNLSYWLGRKGGRKLINFYCKATVCPRECAERACRFLARFGVVSVALARFFVGIRAVASPAAGMTKMSWTRFALSDAAGALLWAGCFVLAGRLFGHLAVSGVERWSVGGKYVLLGLGIAVGGFLLYKWLRVKRSGLLDATALEEAGRMAAASRAESDATPPAA